MPDQIPVEAQELKRQFEEEEARKAAEKAARKSSEGQREIKVIPRRNLTAREIMDQARNVGCTIETGGGKHGTHIKGPDGREISLPVHGGGVTLATGTARSIDKWLSQYRSAQVAPARVSPLSSVPTLNRARGK